tara:strand:- start:43 stop:450 length:408 start_codon:yes stop_codon:yes gene_type:complete
MNLIKVNRMPSIFDTVDGLFDGLFNDYPNNLSMGMPNYDISSDNSKYTIEMEVPGIKKSEISIEAQDQIIKISAKRDSDNNSYSNASSREFEKEFNLPDDAVEKNISANLKNGILEIKIPRKAEVKTKAIKIAVK